MKAATSGRAAARVRLSHHVIRLDDGHQVGVSVGGRGVPLVFLHGLGLSRRAYLRLLSRVAALGFLVVAVDTQGMVILTIYPATQENSATARTLLSAHWMHSASSRR